MVYNPNNTALRGKFRKILLLLPFFSLTGFVNPAQFVFIFFFLAMKFKGNPQKKCQYLLPLVFIFIKLTKENKVQEREQAVVSGA